MSNANTNFTNHYKYKDEYKFTLTDNRQLNKIIKYIRNNYSKHLPEGKFIKTQVFQKDSYYDDKNLTLHAHGITLRLRKIDNEYKLYLKKRVSDDHQKTSNSLYQRMKEKEDITEAEAIKLQKSGYLDNKWCLNLLSAIQPNLGKLTEKVPIDTKRTIISMQVEKEPVLEIHLDEMRYSIDHLRIPETFYEMEIEQPEPSKFNGEIFRLIDNLIKTFELTIWDKSKYDRGVFLFKRQNHMQMSLDHSRLIKKYNISDYTKKIKIFDKIFKGKGWNALTDIYNECLMLKPYIENEKNNMLSELTGMTAVHSIRSRVKDPEHLVEKILRKNIEYYQNGKHLNMNNFNEYITDLIGIRILHLYKTDCMEIDDQISTIYKPEDIIEKEFYIRNGDDLQFAGKKEIDKRNFALKVKESGYRSLHYVIKRNVFLDTGKRINVFAEIQVRTVFEEAWSEIDHGIRYPYYENEAVITEYLKTFNRIAGSADEMATFLKTHVDKFINSKVRM